MNSSYRMLFYYSDCQSPTLYNGTVQQPNLGNRIAATIPISSVIYLYYYLLSDLLFKTFMSLSEIFIFPLQSCNRKNSVSFPNTVWITEVLHFLNAFQQRLTAARVFSPQFTLLPGELLSPPALGVRTAVRFKQRLIKSKLSLYKDLSWKQTETGRLLFAQTRDLRVRRTCTHNSRSVFHTLCNINCSALCY